jgi:diguanylate cyclase (GGDEF)-like protein
MIRFIVEVTREADITDVKCALPEDVIKVGDDLDKLFGDAGKKKINCFISDPEANNRNMTMLFRYRGCLFSVTINVFKIESSVIITGFSSEGPDSLIIDKFVRIYNDYVNSMRVEFKRILSQREENSRSQFEEIQILNNEIINTRRMLEKANIRLKDANSELEKKLVKDALTGLVGRYQYWTEIETVINENPGKYGIFIFIDIDDFKSVNDSFGHAAGDEYLVEFASRLKSIDLPETVKIRIAGDEFALFIYNISQITDNICKEIWEIISKNVISKPIVVSQNALNVSISAGMSLYGVDSTRLSEIIEFADFSMYRAKLKGKNTYHRFDRIEYDKAKGKSKE